MLATSSFGSIEVQTVSFVYDENFFLDRSYLMEFCKALLSRDLPSWFHWIVTAVGRRVAKSCWLISNRQN